MKRRNESIEDHGFGLSFADALLGMIGSGAVIGFLLLANVSTLADVDRSEPKLGDLLKEYVQELRGQSEVIEDLQDDLQTAHDKIVTANRRRHQDAEAFAKHEHGMADALARAKEEASTAQDAATAAKDELGRIKAMRQVRIYFVVDISASMGEGIEQVRNTLGMLAKTMPIALNSFEVGVIGYRDDKLFHLELQPVLAEEDDDGASLAAVNTFLAGFEPIDGWTCVGDALDTAMERLERGGTEQGAEIILLCADVGPGDLDGYDRVAGNEVVERTARWAERPLRNRRVVALSTASKESDHLEFFQELGAVNEDSLFSTNLAAMFPLVFRAAFETDETS